MQVRLWLRQRQKALLIEAALMRGVLLGGGWMGLFLLRGLPRGTTRIEALGLFLGLWLGSLGLLLLLFPPRLDLLEEDQELDLGMGLMTLLGAEGREPSLMTPLLESWIAARIPSARGTGMRKERKQVRRWISILLILLSLLFWLLILPGGRGGTVPDAREGRGHKRLDSGVHPSPKVLPPSHRRSARRPKTRDKKKRGGSGGTPPRPKQKKIGVVDRVVLPAFREGRGTSGRKAPRFARAPKEVRGGEKPMERVQQKKEREEKQQRTAWRERLKRSLERGKLRPFEADWLRSWGRILERKRGTKPDAKK